MVEEHRADRFRDGQGLAASGFCTHAESGSWKRVMCEERRLTNAPDGFFQIQILMQTCRLTSRRPSAPLSAGPDAAHQTPPRCHSRQVRCSVRHHLSLRPASSSRAPQSSFSLALPLLDVARRDGCLGPGSPPSRQSQCYCGRRDPAPRPALDALHVSDPDPGLHLLVRAWPPGPDPAAVRLCRRVHATPRSSPALSLDAMELDSCHRRHRPFCRRCHRHLIHDQT